MAKKNKKNFIGNSKNVIWALLIVAAAVTVYGIAQAATVSHTPEEIAPQGPGSGLDSDTLWGLTSADILSAGGGSSGGSSLVQWGYGTNSPGDGAAQCPPGWTESYSGYGPFLVGKEVLYGGYSASASSMALTSANVCVSSTGIIVSGTVSTSGGASDWGMVAAACRGSQCNTCRVCVPKQESSAGSSTPSAGTTFFYSTKSKYNGNLGGRSGADSKCTAELPPELNGKVTNIHAFLSAAANDEIRDMHTVDSDSDGTVKSYYESMNQIYGYNRQWGEWSTIATSWRDLLDGTIGNKLEKALSFPSGLPAYSTYWTGSEYDGSASGTDCNKWTSVSAYGTSGGQGYTNTIWLSWSSSSCSTQLSLVCAAKYTG